MADREREQGTPTPWAIEENVLAGGVRHLAITNRAAGKDWMPCSVTRADLARDVDYANARLIVRAVNAHAELVAALEAAEAALMVQVDSCQTAAPGTCCNASPEAIRCRVGDTVATIRAALAKAKS